MRLFLLRHGETDWNNIKKIQGRSDVPLNENGLLQAHEAADKLKYEKYDAVFSSPLQRAKVTADIIAAPHGLPVQVDERLVEMSFGLIEGTTPDYRELNPNRAYLFTAPEAYVPTKGGESFEDVSTRCQSFLDYLSTTEYNNVLVVAHGALIQSMLRTIKKTPLSEFWEKGCLKNCDTYEIDYPFTQEALK